MSGTSDGAAPHRGVELREPTTGNYFVSTYPPFSCWSAAETPAYRQRLCERPAADDAPLGLYVHIPFCVDRCQYCYYLSHEDKLAEADRYLAALASELRQYSDLPYLGGRSLSFVYFGGGTPSILSATRIERLLDSLQASLPWKRFAEVTFECAPRSVTESKLRILKDKGVTRISLGAQQMDDDVLRRNGRVHLADDVERAYEQTRRVGFDIVNVDLIVGLVGETEESYRRSLERIIHMAPESVTIYQLEIPHNTPLYRSIRERGTPSDLATWETKHARLTDCMARLTRAGYTQCSGYAAVRDPERHRFVYQDEQYRGADLLGIGTSAFSHLAGANQQNETSLKAYLDRCERGELPLSRAHVLTDEERLVREFVLQLKLGSIDTRDFQRKFGVDVTDRFASALGKFTAAGWIELGSGHIRVTPSGLPRVDRLLTEFYLDEHRNIRYS